MKLQNRTVSLFLAFSLIIPCNAFCADIVIVADAQLKPVAEIVSNIRKNLKASVAVYTPTEANHMLQQVVAKEGAKAVIALGKDAIDEALLLPPSIGVIYDLVLLPLKVNRTNTTGTYMATPVNEYLNVLRRFLPSIKQVSIVSSLSLQKILGVDGHGQVANYRANSSFEFVNTVQQLGGADALLLLPDVSLLTAAAMEKIYLYSFRKSMPVLGISEKNVKQGALFALVFDPASVGKHLAKLATEALKGADLSSIPVSPPKKFDMYINRYTAEKMGIDIPDEMLRQAKKVFSHG